MIGLCELLSCFSSAKSLSAFYKQIESEFGIWWILLAINGLQKHLISLHLKTALAPGLFQPMKYDKNILFGMLFSLCYGYMKHYIWCNLSWLEFLSVSWPILTGYLWFQHQHCKIFMNTSMCSYITFFPMWTSNRYVAFATHTDTHTHTHMCIYKYIFLFYSNEVLIFLIQLYWNMINTINSLYSLMVVFSPYHRSCFPHSFAWL